MQLWMLGWGIVWIVFERFVWDFDYWRPGDGQKDWVGCRLDVGSGKVFTTTISIPFFAY